MDFVTIKTEAFDRKLYIKKNDSTINNNNPYFQFIAKTDLEGLDETNDWGHIFTVIAIPGDGDTKIAVYNNIFEGFFGSTGELIASSVETPFTGEVAGVTTFLSQNDTDQITFTHSGSAHYISIGSGTDVQYLTFDSRDNTTKWLKINVKTPPYQYFYTKWVIAKAANDPIPPL